MLCNDRDWSLDLSQCYDTIYKMSLRFLLLLVLGLLCSCLHCCFGLLSVVRNRLFPASVILCFFNK